MTASVVFLVTSVIYFVEHQRRSIFSPEERAVQTAQTIQSIRSRVPDAHIILIELGQCPELPHQLKKLSDRYIYFGDEQMVRHAVDGHNKGYGEGLGLVLAGPTARALNANFYFKISGRYTLTDEFDLGKWLAAGDGLIAKRTIGTHISTRLYGFRGTFFDVWHKSMERALPLLDAGHIIEEALPMTVSSITHMQQLGVSGILAQFNLGVRE